MRIDIVKLEVIYWDYPSNSSIHGQVRSIKRIELGQLITERVPQVGEIISMYPHNYKVQQVIRECYSDNSEHFAIQVENYVVYRGNVKIPLVIELPPSGLEYPTTHYWK